MATTQKRLAALEMQVKTLSKIIQSGVIQKEDDLWLKVMDASHVLRISPDTLRRKIRESQANPSLSRYQKGVHWDGEPKSYRVNVSRWHTAN
jgi:hypothetical protein